MPRALRVKAFLPRTRWCGDSLVRDYGVDPERIRVSPAGLDTDWWCPAPVKRRSEPPVLLFVGDDFERKGGPFLVDLFSRYIYPRARLRMVMQHVEPGRAPAQPAFGEPGHAVQGARRLGAVCWAQHSEQLSQAS